LHGFLDFGAVFDVVKTEAFLVDLEVVVAFLAENVVDVQSNMRAYFVSQCFVVMCVGLLLVIALRILVVAFLVFMFRASCPHWIGYATEFG